MEPLRMLLFPSYAVSVVSQNPPLPTGYQVSQFYEHTVFIVMDVINLSVRFYHSRRCILSKSAVFVTFQERNFH